MIETLDYKYMPDFSGLFLDYVDSKPFFKERFPSNEGLFSADSLELLRHSETFQDRGEVIKAVMTSTENITLSTAQNANLELLKERDTLTVITGQQVGFMSSPLYILLKIYSCINLAAKLNKVHSILKFVPVFWIEDNDHDSLEASQSAVFNENYDIERFTCCPDCSKTDRTSVSARTFDEGILDIIDHIGKALPDAQFKAGMTGLLKKTYIPGRSWSGAFTGLLQGWLSGTGVLFVRSSVMRKQGLYAELAERELEMSGLSDEIINNSNREILANHYHIQAKTSEVNLFMHMNGQRYKILKDRADSAFLINDKQYTHKDLLNMARAEPGAFSPNVLLRPVFQERIFPNAAYIAGPSEIGYATQLKDIYRHFGLRMPAFIARHSATFLNHRITRFLDKQGLRPEYFLKPSAELEPELRHKLLNNNVAETLTSSRQSINGAFDSLRQAASEIDANLVSSAEAARQKTMNQMDTLEKKIFSAQKKHNDLTYEKFRQASHLIYPGGSLQERVVSPFNFMAECGPEKFLEILDMVTKLDNDRHYFVQI